MKATLRFGLMGWCALGLWAQDPAPPAVDASGTNCSFQASRDEYLDRQVKAQREVAARVQFLAQGFAAESTRGAALVDPNSIPRRNFIDDQIFGRMAAARVRSAPLSTDAEFVRRIYLDLTGRLPSAAEVRAFLASNDSNKRSQLINDLLYSPAFVDKWTLWLGDLVQNRVNTTAFQTPNVQGRNAYYKYLWSAISDNKPLKDVAIESISAGGNNYDEPAGPANFAILSVVGGGPNEDIYDAFLVRSATTFLGLSHYDCLLCHNGRGHTEQLSVWATRTSRFQAQQMSAFFSRFNRRGYTFPPGTPPEVQRADFYNGSFFVEDVTNRNYSLRTTFGNRPNRVPFGTQATLNPAWSLSHNGEPKSAFWRTEFAEYLVKEPLFGINLANRLWKQMFNMALAEPVDQLDPDRLDPSNPPPAPWTLQATHPELLVALGREFANNNFDLRYFLRLIAESSAYQLSSRYDGDWNASMVPLFARHYARRLDGEEIHDAIVKSTGVFTNYTIQFWGDPFRWATSLPDPREPVSNGASANFMNLFLRGNRETQPRSQQGSVLQQLALMNDTFVTNRIKIANSPVLRDLARLTDNGALVDEMFLNFVSRMPTADEKAKAVAFLNRATGSMPTAATNARNAAIEDLAWTLVNRIDFLFSY
jgi:hypothetical protein